MKLIIDIPDNEYHQICELRLHNRTFYDDAIRKGTPLDKIRAEIFEEKDCAYADFDKYKVDYLGVDSRYVEDELPYDDFRYGMERCIEIIDKYRKEQE